MPNSEVVPTGPMRLATSDLVDVSRLDAARQQQVAVIAQSVQARDSNTIATFGAGPQRKLSSFLDQLLAGARAEDIGLAGELVTELATDMKALDLPAVKREVEGGATSVLARLPVVGKYYGALRRFRAMQKTVVEHLAAIERKADIHLGKLKAGNAGLDRLLDATEDNLRELEVWVAAGQQALARMRAELEAERAALGDVRDPVALAKLRDTAEQIDAFETRVVRMHVAFTRGVLSVPQVRIAQQAGRIEIQNTLDTVLFDLPDLKAAIVRVAALHQISRAGGATAARRRIGQELQQIGIDALDQSYTRAKQSQGDMGADVELLSQMGDKIMATLNRGLEIDRENRVKRDQAVQQLGEVRSRLMEGLRAHADDARQPGGISPS